MNNKNTLQNIFIFSLFALLFALILCMMKPFATILLWTVLLYILIRPVYIKALSKLRPSGKFFQAKRHLCAGGFAVGTLLLIAAPIAFICIQLIQQGISFLQLAETYVMQNSESLFSSETAQKLLSFAESLEITIPDADFISMKNSVLSLIQTYSFKLLYIGSAVVNKTGAFLVSLLFVVFALYFCFLDGPYLGTLIKKAVPINPAHMKVLTHKFADITKNLFSGYILVALYQGIAAFVIMLCFRIPAAMLLSVTLMLASFIPLFGAAVVWLPVGIALCVTGSAVKGIIFLIISAVCISFLDNFLRPFFLKDRIHVHPLVIFFAILGGIKVFGMNGLILGPLIVILFFTVLDLLVAKNEKEAEEVRTSVSEQ